MFSAALNISRTLRRLPKILPIVGLVALCALLGAARAHTQSLDTTSTALQMSATSINLGDSVTFTVTVTGTTAPVGTVNLTSQQNGGTLNTFASGVTLTPINSTQSQAVYPTNSFAAGSYTIVAKFRTSDSGSWSNSSSSGQILAVGAVVIHNTAMSLNVQPLSVNQGDSATLVAQVSTTDGSGVIPTGVVSFHAIQNGGSGTDTLLGTANLDGTGTATLPSGPWLAGSYTITASYSGDAFDHAAGAQLTLTVGSGGGNKALTTTVVIASPQVIHTGDSTTFDAYVVQTGTTLSPPAGDAVEFKANGIFIGQANLNINGHAILTIGGWLEGQYQIEADYVGDLFYATSSGATTVSVSTPKPTTTTYTGGTSVLYGQQVTLSGHLVDATSGATLSNQLLRIGVNAGHPGGELGCSGQTDSNGNFSCTVTDTLLPGSYPIAVAFDGAGAYLPSGANNTLVVSPLTTTTTAKDVSTSTGTPTTLSGKVVDQFGNPLPAGTSVTLSVPVGGESCTGLTDSLGNVNCVITPSEGPGSWPIVASFGGLPAYLASSGNATMTIVSGIPTTLTYTGDTSVVQGNTAHISFVLKDANTGVVLNGMPVTIHFDGGTYPVTTDALGRAIVSPDPTVNDTPGSNLPATAAFSGRSPYLASNGTGNVFVTSPTSWTYTGPSSVTEGSNGGKTLISFVLKDGQGLVLPNMTVSLAFGSQTCDGLTTAADGSVSCLIDTPAPGQDGGYTPTASFAGTTGYGASNGSGSFIVVAPTSLSYTGDTTGTRGGTATLQGVLTDAVNGQVLSGRTVTWTIGNPGNTQSCSATTDANGLASCPVVLSLYASATPYPVSGAFTGTTYYGPSSATGGLTIAPTVLTVTADNQSMTLGGTVPPLTYSMTGFINGETLATSDVTGAAACTTTASSSSTAGVYPITCALGSLASTNYTFRFVPAQISILYAAGCPNGRKCESIIADPSPAQGAQVTPGQTMQLVYMDDAPIGTGSNGYCAPTVSLNGQLIPITVTPTSGQPQNYVDTYGGSTGTKYESLVSFQVPNGLATGQYTFIVTICDGDGDGDQWAWNVGVGMPGNGGGGTGGGGAVTLDQCKATFNGAKCESILADPTPTQGAQVTPGQTMSIVYMDDSPIGNGGKYPAPTVSLNGQQIPVTVTPTSGYSQNYVDSWGGSTAAKNQALLTFQVPAGLANGQYSFLLTVYDGDGDGDLWSWNVGVGMSGAGGGSGSTTTGTATSLALADSTPSLLLANKAISLSATLTSGGKALPNENVVLTVRYDDADTPNVSCTAKTTKGGVATCNVTPTDLGEGDVMANFLGDNTYAASSDGDEAAVVSAYPMSLAFGTLPVFHYNKGAAVSATLFLNGTPFAGGKVTFTIGSSSCTVNSNGSGVASCNITPKVSGPTTLTVSYAGDATHTAATASQAITVLNP